MTRSSLVPLPGLRKREPAPPQEGRPPFRDTAASAWLDLIRGLAAILVLLDHTHHLFFSEIPANASHQRLLALIYGITNSGPQAVVVFFVLSGYLVSGSVLRWIARDQWSWKRYLTHRLVRLWIVLLPALLLCAAWDTARILLHTPATGFLAAADLQGLTIRNLLGNIFFLQTIRTQTFGSDRVLWSLAFEFWYYILFPMAALALNRRTPGGLRLLYAIAFLPIAALVGRSILALFPIWLLGVALHKLKPPLLPPFVRGIAIAAYLGVFVYLSLHPWVSHFFKPDYVLGLATALLIFTMLSARKPALPHSRFGRTSRWLASFSYSLYLVHYPLLAFVSAALLHGDKHWAPDATHLLLGLFLAFFALLYGFIIGRLTESHNDQIRDRMEQHLGIATHPSRERLSGDRKSTKPPHQVP